MQLHEVNVYLDLVYGDGLLLVVMPEECVICANEADVIVSFDNLRKPSLLLQSIIGSLDSIASQDIFLT